MENKELKICKRPALSRTIFAVLALILLGAVDQAQGQWTTTGNDISNTNTGNVGVGTSTPTAKLHVSASSNVMAKVQSSTGSAELDLISNASGAGSWGLGTGWASAGLRNLYLYDNVAGATRMLFDSSGKVGIGTTSPSYSLDVNGGVNGFRAKAATVSSNDAIATFENSNGIQAIVRGNGYLGLGTAAPNFNLDVNRGGAAADVYLGIDANGSSTYSPVLYFRNTGTAISKIMTTRDLQFQNTNNTPLMYLKTTGNVGIGTTNPLSPLDVAGNINSSGTITGANIIAKYQDVAEWVESSQALPGGTVVVLDHTRSNQVIASSQAYDTRVAGVISSQPGITLGEKGESKVLVATTGRVKVRVDATAGPIQIGDLLVTSGKGGLAMKSQSINIGGVQIHRPGTLIGKALEPLATGTGEILVLLSLQ